MKFHEMTSPDLAAVDRDSTLVIVPIAAIEQHGPHLATGTDFFLCGAVAEAVEQHLPDRILLTPVLPFGASAHHLRFGATLDSALDSYIDTLCDLGRSLLNDGYRRVLFLNGHGGNIDPMKVAIRKLQSDFPETLLAAGCYWSPSDADREAILEGGHKFVGHACEFETSLMLHLRPDLVRRDRLADAGELVTDNIDGVFLSRDMKHRTREGCTGRPDLASAEKGERLFQAAVNRLVATCEKLAAAPLGGDYLGEG